jgi:hypothetical protein
MLLFKKGLCESITIETGVLMLTKIHHLPYASQPVVLSPVVAPHPNPMNLEPRPPHILHQDPLDSLTWQVVQDHHQMSQPANINTLMHKKIFYAGEIELLWS